MRKSLDEVPGYVLKQVESVLTASMDAALRPMGLSVAQYACMALLAQEPTLTSSQLARRTFVSRQSMNATLRRLGSTGWVERDPDDAVGRQRPYHLTEAGRQALESAQARIDAVEDRMVAGMSSSDVASLTRALQTCLTALTAPEER